MGTSVNNNYDRTAQEIAKRRLEYENKKNDIKGGYGLLSIFGGATSGFLGFLSGGFASAAIEDTILDDFALTGAGIPIIAGLGVALGGACLSIRYANKKINENIAKLNKEYADVLTQEEIKKYNIDIQS